MSRYINADELKERLKKDDFDLSYHWSYVQMLINEMPPADVRENKHGEWKEVTNGRGGHECSLCGNYAPSYQSGTENLSDFCPNCGADMRKRKDDNVRNME